MGKGNRLANWDDPAFLSCDMRLGRTSDPPGGGSTLDPPVKLPTNERIR